MAIVKMDVKEAVDMVATYIALIVVSKIVKIPAAVDVLELVLKDVERHAVVHVQVVVLDLATRAVLEVAWIHVPAVLNDII